MLPLLLLPILDVPPPTDAATVRAVWLADLTPERVTSGTAGCFVFVPDSRPDEVDGRVLVEAAGPAGVLRTVHFAKGETDEASTSSRPSSSGVSLWLSGTRRGASSRPSSNYR